MLKSYYRLQKFLGKHFEKYLNQYILKGLHQRFDKTFIFPTRFGFLFGILSLALLTFSIGFGNNIVSLFVFLLISVAIATMRVTNNNIVSAVVKFTPSNDYFAGEKNILDLKISSKKQGTFLYDIRLGWLNTEKTKIVNEIQKNNFFNMPWTPEKRGYQHLPTLQLESDFPFGFLRAWKYLDLNTSEKTVCFPERRGEPLNLKIAMSDSAEYLSYEQLQKYSGNSGEISGLASFQKTDKLNHIDWKKFAQRNLLLVKKFDSADAVSARYRITWSATAHLVNTETRISQMALWVQNCNDLGIFYQLNLPYHTTDFNSGRVHYLECMTSLALLTESELQEPSSELVSL